jgi:crotonobetainyl-CoA:carnitine CoA-transferase CaiB-like acyl-CoA transferase
MGAFAGLRLIETGSLAPARLVGAFFGEMGAEVIRIVPPRRGTAGAAPGEGEEGAGEAPGWSRMLPLDLFEPRGIGLLQRLLRRADILVDGHSPGALAGLGLPPERLAADNPGLLCVRVAAFQEPAEDRSATATAALLAALVALHRRHRTGLGGEVTRPIRIAVADPGRPEPGTAVHRVLLGLSEQELTELQRDGVI